VSQPRIFARHIGVFEMLSAFIPRSVSTPITATNPLCYVIVMGLVAAFVAYGRFTLRPLNSNGSD
jgi:hypothetical protein